MHAARYIIAALVALFGFISYCSTTSENPVTGEKADTVDFGLGFVF